MKKMLIYPAIALFLFCIILFACSKSEDVDSEKGKIEKMTEHTANMIVEKIQTPIDKARSVKGIQEDRMKDIDETLNEQ